MSFDLLFKVPPLCLISSFTLGFCWLECPLWLGSPWTGVLLVFFVFVRSWKSELIKSIHSVVFLCFALKHVKHSKKQCLHINSIHFVWVFGCCIKQLKAYGWYVLVFRDLWVRIPPWGSSYHPPQGSHGRLLPVVVPLQLTCADSRLSTGHALNHLPDPAANHCMHECPEMHAGLMMV